MKMKEIRNSAYYNKEFLETDVEVEKRRAEIFKRLMASGYRPYHAFQESKRRSKNEHICSIE